MTESSTRMIDVSRAIQIAHEHHQAGRLPDAEQLYRQILQFDPGNADALQFLGLIALQAGQPGPYFELADALSMLGRFGEAEHWYRLGIGLDPDLPIPRYNLGIALYGLGRLDEAARSYADAAALKPDFSEAHFSLANTLKVLGKLAEAEFEYRRVLELKPDYVEAHNNRGIVLADLGRAEEAERSYRSALAIRPAHAFAHNNLGNLLRGLGRHEEAEQCYRQAIAHNPGLAEAHDHLANSLLDLGRLGEAEDCYRRALALDPGLARGRSNFLLFLNYVPGRPPASIFDEHCEFDRRCCAPAGPRPHPNVADPGRRLRVGYVSGDLRAHSVAFFIEPILARHDHGRFEIFCYYNFPRADAVTQRLKSCADHWRDVHALGDEALVDLIRADAIDILVDLSGHTAGNRLAVFGRKPAPVQATYLGYPATTGLAAMDYRVTDAVLDPEAEGGRWYTEELVRLPHAMWCYQPDDGMPAVSPPPELRAGGVTFGSFNYFAKLNPEVTTLWARLLERLPEARLVVTRIPGANTEGALRRRFEESGIAPDRLELHGILPRQQLGELFSRVDIALDTFPYGGTTTTCDVLWMGIPLVTLDGATSASRSGASLLRAVGLEDLMAVSREQYLDIAAGLARDTGRLAAIRGSLRERMRVSPLTDAAGFARNLEAAYRAMWQSWCRSRQR